MVLLLVVAGLVVAGLAVAFAEWTGKPSSLVLFSGQSALPSFVTNSVAYSVGTLLLLIVCKGLAYGISLSGFRGGPAFPGMFIGAAGGMVLSHAAGLPEVAGVAMGMGAMLSAILGLPLTSVLLTTIFMGSDGLNVMLLSLWRSWLPMWAVLISHLNRALPPRAEPPRRPRHRRIHGREQAPPRPDALRSSEELLEGLARTGPRGLRP